jgi:uncharacterized membrane protein
MWWLLAFGSAVLLGGYDSFKKFSLKDNAVVPVLFLNTVLCALIFSPGLFLTGFGGWAVQKYIVAKSALVLSSWMAGYIAMKHLPLTIVGPVNATRPVLVLVGAIFLFGEQLNGLQWTGVALAIFAYFLMRHSSEKEGYRAGNKWILYLILSVLLGAASGLYDKYLMSPGYLGLDRMQVLSWYSFYQSIMMAVVMLLGWMPTRHSTTPFRWRWSIPFISIFLCAADFLYMQALSDPDALIAVVSMIRRGSVLVSFGIGAWILKEKNLKSKAVDLALLLVSMVFLYLGSR